VWAWTGIAVCLAVVQLTSRWLAGDDLRMTARSVLAGWNHFDGPEYIQIASHGYTYRQLVWFPLYPSLIRVVNGVVGDLLLSGVVVSGAAGLIATILLWRWLELKVPDRTERSWALAAILLYPYGWYLFGVVYSDALFLALVVGAFLLVERDRLVWAGLVGALATATRPTGVALIAALLLTALERRGVVEVAPDASSWIRSLRLPTRVRLDRLRPASFAPLLSVLGLGGYMAYQWVEWGSPVRFVTVQRLYHDSGFRSVLKFQYFQAWSSGAEPRQLLTTTAQGLVIAFVLLTASAVGRRFGWGYALFVATLAAIPALSVENFMGAGRYLMAAFPVFAWIGASLARRRVARVVVLSAAAGLLLLMAFGYGRSWYLT
jgi:hypothetical protein